MYGGDINSNHWKGLLKDYYVGKKGIRLKARKDKNKAFCFLDYNYGVRLSNEFERGKIPNKGKHNQSSERIFICGRLRQWK